MSELQEGWVETTLGDVINLVGGGTPKTSILEYWNGVIPWLSVVDFNNNNRWVSKTEKSITNEGLNNSSTKLLETGDLIISARGTVGALAQLKVQMAFNQSCYGIKEKEDISDINFLYYLIKFSLLKIGKHFHGAVFDTITRQTFDNIQSNLPPLPEQKAIAKVLSAFDEKIELLREQKETLETIAQTTFKEWFVNFNYPGATGEMVESELGEITKGWSTVKIIKLFEVRDGTHDSPKQQKTGKFLITSKHLLNHSLDIDNAYLISEENYQTINKRSLVDTNDILFSMIGTIGLIYFEQSDTINYAIKNIGLFKTSQNLNWTYYTYLWLTSLLGKDFVYSNKSGSTQEYISLTNLRNIIYCKPPLELLDSFNAGMKKIFEKIKSNTVQIQTLSKARDTLLPKLMSGQVRTEGFDQ
jgi:type I restriction enzyme S subunit